MTSALQLIRVVRQFLDFAMHHTVRERAHYVKATGLSMPQFGILMQLQYRQNCGVSDISEQFDITTAAASQSVDRLVQGGFIGRVEDPKDRRAKILNLTEKGRQIVQQGAEEHYRWVDELVGKLTIEERTKINDAMLIIIQAANELDAEPVQSLT